nr:hypothetical protein [Synechococcus sp. AH-779-G23]
MNQSQGQGIAVDEAGSCTASRPHLLDTKPHRYKGRANESIQGISKSHTNNDCGLCHADYCFGLWIAWTESMEPSNVAHHKL